MVHIPEIDSEHQVLFRLADELHRAILDAADAESIDSMLQELLRCAAEHFAHEERIMSEIAYPGYEWHRKQHATLTAKVTSLARQFKENGDRHVPLDLLRALSDWLKDHTRTSDTMMAAYLRNYHRAHRSRVS